jgi:hypothetical protein
MKKIIIPILLVSFTLISCRKILDIIFEHQNNDHSVPCKVTEIAYQKNDADYHTTIDYNDDGYPIAINYHLKDNLQFNTPLDYTFEYTYDDQKRLILERSDFVYIQPGYRYVYEGNDQWPVRDTTPGLLGDIYTEEFEYDNHHRIIKITKAAVYLPDGADPSDFPETVLKYYYDENGNRQEDPANPNYPGVIIYNNKPSIVSLHPVWKLVSRDFSKNSVDYGKTYNDKGLPTEIKTETTQYFQIFLNLTRGSTVAYECN